MSGVLIYNKTGERFNDEGNYNKYAHMPDAGITSNPYRINRITFTPYNSPEINNRVYETPSDSTQEHFDRLKPLDCGSMKILSNNISHLIYQKCRTLAVAYGPGTIGYTDSDISSTVTNPATGIVYPRIRDITGIAGAGIRSIGWSFYSSRRLGPFFGIVDRRIQYGDQFSRLSSISSTLMPTIEDNAYCLRKMICVVEGYLPAGASIDIYSVVTEDGGNPRNPSATILTVDEAETVYYEILEGATLTKGTVRSVGAGSYGGSLVLQSSSGQSKEHLVTPTGGAGTFKVFIPLSVTSNIRANNFSAQGVSLFQFFVHVGWSASDANAGIGTITLLETRDPGSQIGA